MLAYELVDGYNKRLSNSDELKSDINDVTVPNFNLSSSEEVKNRVLSDYTKAIARISVNSVDDSASISDIMKWYQETSKSLAQELSAKLQSSNYLTDSNGTSQIITGANFKLKVQNKEASDNNTYDDNVKKKIGAVYAATQEQLQLYLDKMADCKDNVAYSIIEMLKNNDTSGIANKYSEYLKETGIGTLEITDEKIVKDGDKKFFTNIKNLHNIMISLQKIKGGETSVYVRKVKQKDAEGNEKLVDKTIEDPKDFINSLTAVFNALGGEAIGEALAVSCVNKSQETIQKAIDDTNKNLNSLGNITAKQVEYETRSSLRGNRVQIKPDFWIDFTQNGIQMKMGGSLKIRQGKKFNFGKKGGEVQPANKSTTLGTWLKITEKNSNKNFTQEHIKNFEQAWSAFRNGTQNEYDNNYQIPSSKYDSWNEKWQEMKEYAKYIIALSELAGTLIENDAASIFIVNYQVFSIYDVLDSIDKTIKQRGKDVKVASFVGWGDKTFPQLRAQYIKKMKSEKVKEPDERSQDMIAWIYKQKLSLKINSIRLESILKNL